jgi:hypothetical protein
MLREIHTFFNKLLLTIQFWFWRKSHTMQDFESRLVELGCTKVSTRNSIIFTTANGKGKIEVTDDEVIINP